MGLIDRLAGLQLVVVTGKGGVGKSTVAATLAQILAAAGKRTLVLEIDPRESLYPLFGASPSGGEIQPVGRSLYIQNLAPRAVLDQLVRERVRIGLIARRVLAHPVYAQFAEGAPGLKQMAVLGHVLRLVRGEAGSASPEIDVVVLDAPATGHGVSLLAAPGLVSDVIVDGPFGALGRELAGFVADPRCTGVLAVTTAEEMPVQETIELVADLDARLGRRPEAIVVNQLYPGAAGAGPVEDSEPAAGVEGAERPDPVEALWLHRRDINRRELGRLAAAWKGPSCRLPLLPHDRGVELAEALRERLALQLGSRS